VWVEDGHYLVKIITKFEFFECERESIDWLIEFMTSFKGINKERVREGESEGSEEGEGVRESEEGKRVRKGESKRGREREGERGERDERGESERGSREGE
jgi:hypothetical protein